MKSFVKDPYMKRYAVSLQALAKARPSDRFKKDLGALSMPGTSNAQIEEPEILPKEDDAASDRSVSPIQGKKNF